MSTRPGSRLATIRLKCGCEIHTDSPMFLFRARKGELRFCSAHGPQGIRQIESRHPSALIHTL